MHKCLQTFDILGSLVNDLLSVFKALCQPGWLPDRFRVRMVTLQHKTGSVLGIVLETAETIMQQMILLQIENFTDTLSIFFRSAVIQTATTDASWPQSLTSSIFLWRSIIDCQNSTYLWQEKGISNGNKMNPSEVNWTAFMPCYPLIIMWWEKGERMYLLITFQRNDHDSPGGGSFTQLYSYCI